GNGHDSELPYICPATSIRYKVSFTLEQQATAKSEEHRSQHIDIYYYF
ncbi:13512_t:CDS:1, partial [Acaulospora colombiana]